MVRNKGVASKAQAKREPDGDDDEGDAAEAKPQKRRYTTKSPNGKQGDNQAASSSSGPAAGLQPGGISTAVKENFNAEYFMKIRTMKQEIFAHEVFADVCSLAPLPLDASLNPDMTGRQVLLTTTQPPPRTIFGIALAKFENGLGTQALFILLHVLISLFLSLQGAIF